MADVALQYLNSMRIAAIRHRGVHDARLTDATWQELIVWAATRGLMGRHPEVRGVGLVWDDPRKEPRDRRYDVGVPITPDDDASVDGIGFVLVTAPGRYLRAVHIGPYERLGETYEDVMNGPLRYDGWQLLAQPIVEVYRDSPSEVPLDDLHTDIYFPVIKST